MLGLEGAERELVCKLADVLARWRVGDEGVELLSNFWLTFLNLSKSSALVVGSA